MEHDDITLDVIRQEQPAPAHRFDLGSIQISPAARDALRRAGQCASYFVQRHAAGDWGETRPAGLLHNDAALASGHIYLGSTYTLSTGARLWVTTERDIGVTSVTLNRSERPRREPTEDLAAPGAAEAGSPLFELGAVRATRAALRALAAADRTAVEFVARHVCGDFGDLIESDRRDNQQAIAEGSMVFSAYQVTLHVRLYVITEGSLGAVRRAFTTVMLATEFGEH